MTGVGGRRREAGPPAPFRPAGRRPAPPSLSEKTVDELLAVAHAAADAAGPPSLAAFRAVGLRTENKSPNGGFDPVTAADRDAEAAIRAVLAERRPDDAVVGEEGDDRPGSSGLAWRIDPIDGTRAFICGAPTWGVLIGLHDGRRPVLGVIDQPFTGERFTGRVGEERRETRWSRGGESRPLCARPCVGLAEATLCTTFPEIGSPRERGGFEKVRDRARLTRYGLDCYAYGLLAMGCVDLVIEAGLQPYDVAALIPIVEGAGGLITDWNGGPCDGGGRVLAAGDVRTHVAAIEILSRV